MRIALALNCLALVVAGIAAGAEPAPKYDRRWAWVMTNLLVEKEADRVVALAGRAGKAGYNGLVIADYKMNFLGRMPASYFAHVARVRAAADRAGVEIIPAVFPIGYSNGLLTNDTNLAEGMPVEDAPFVVKGREAVPVADPSARMKLRQRRPGGGSKGDAFAGFGYQDAPGKATVIDREVVHQAARSRAGCRTCPRPRRLPPDPEGQGPPPRRYRLSCWAKTRDPRRPTGAFRSWRSGRRAAGR